MGRYTKWLIFSLTFCAFSKTTGAQENPPPIDSERKPTAHFKPFIPEDREYGIELGAMWEDNNLYWLGGHMGFHVGRCLFSSSQTCQQYVDAIGGAGGRDGLTIGAVHAALRWQFVNFPNAVSPSVRVMGGAMNIRDDRRDTLVASFGLGYGWTLSIHERMDFLTEVRVGFADRVWSQAFIGVNFKMDRWIDYFSRKLKSLGEGTVDTSGQILKRTLRAPMDMMDMVAPKSESAPSYPAQPPAPGK